MCSSKSCGGVREAHYGPRKRSALLCDKSSLAISPSPPVSEVFPALKLFIQHIAHRAVAGILEMNRDPSVM